MKEEVKWSDEFKIGVKIVDEAHKKLFSIVRRIQSLIEADNEEKSRWACMEGIKYFKTYALEHFMEEEEYMLSIDYPGYTAHKKIHDNMREQVLPALDRDLQTSDYSRESVERFVDACVDWLTNHIMEVDKAITDKRRR